jgi:hypothetical protein
MPQPQLILPPGYQRPSASGAPSFKFNMPKIGVPPKLQRIAGMAKSGFDATRGGLGGAAKTAGTASKFLGAAAIPIAGGIDYFSRKDEGQDDQRAVTGAVASTGGGMAGAAAGAALGSAILPGVGTAVGGLLGYMGGSALGGKTADFANDAIRGRYEGFDSGAAIARAQSDYQDAANEGNTMKMATIATSANDLVKQKRAQDLAKTGVHKSAASVGMGTQQSFMKDQPNPDMPGYSNDGLENVDPQDPELRTEMAMRRANDMQRGNALFQQQLAERGGNFALKKQQEMAGTNTRNSMLANYLAGAQAGNTQTLLSAYSQRY